MGGLSKSMDFFADPLNILSNKGKRLMADPLGILGIGKDKPTPSIESALAPGAPNQQAIEVNTRQRSLVESRMQLDRASSILLEKTDKLGG